MEKYGIGSCMEQNQEWLSELLSFCTVLVKTNRNLPDLSLLFKPKCHKKSLLTTLPLTKIIMEHLMQIGDLYIVSLWLNQLAIKEL
jgi:hypothetical protein